MGKIMINILLTSVGGLAGDFLVRHLSTMSEYRLVGLDIERRVACLDFLDAFYITPKTKSSSYKREIEKICNLEDIDAIIPISSHDVNFFATNNFEQFRFKKIPKILTLDCDSHKLINDKILAYQFCNEIGINTPKIYDEINLEFPSIYKPKSATGSKGIVHLADLEDFNYYMRKFEDGFISEFIFGDEYTCDALFSQEGRCLGHLVRTRNKVKCGAVIVSTTSNVDVSNVIERFEKSKIFRGPINFQFKIKDENIVIFDINDRFASGGLPLSVLVGFDIPKILLELLIGVETIEPFNYVHKKKVQMIKFYSETYFYE